MILIAFMLISFLFFVLLIAGILNLIFKRDMVIQKRTFRYFGEDFEEQEVKHQKDKRKYVINNDNRFKSYIDKKMAKAKKRDLENRLREAGYPLNMTPTDFRFLQIVIGLFLFICIFMLFSWAGVVFISKVVLATIFGAFGMYYPSFYLSTIIKKRRLQIQKDMPDFFDMVNLSIEAGMGLDNSLQVVSHQMRSPISDEFLQTLEDIKLGKPRREAFSDLRHRVPVRQFQSIITSLIQADMLGIGMSKAIRQLTIRIREQRTQFAREQAMKAPVKMVFPMILFIFPAMFIVLMGPLIIHFIQNFL